MAGRELAVIDGNTALAAAPARQTVGGLLRPIAAPADVLSSQNEARDLIQKALAQGRDYGVIPGTGDKPALLKPGAERILAAFGCYAEPEIVEQEVDHDREVRWQKRKKRWFTDRGQRKFTWETEDGISLGLYRYVARCRIVHRESGAVIGWGIGSCSSMESKYVDRPRDSENTVLKMAKKRAQIDGVLSTFGLSDQFTQDVEDNPELYRQDTSGPAPVAQPESEPEPAPAGRPAPEPMSAEQLELIQKLRASHVFTEDERKDVDAVVAKGPSKTKAQKLIDGMLATLRERKAAEAQGGNAQPAVAERIPGADDGEEPAPRSFGDIEAEEIAGQESLGLGQAEAKAPGRSKPAQAEGR